MSEKPKESRIKIAIAVVAVGVALLVGADVAWTVLFGHSHGPNYEGAAIAGLRACLGAQGVFRREDRYGKGALVYANPVDGKGFPDLYRVGGPRESETGDELKLIDIAFARATSAESPKSGYWFVDIIADTKAGPYDFTEDCGLCAVPARYGKSGLHTFIIDARGTVYKKDNGGAAVTIWPDSKEDGWLPADE